MTNEVYRCSTRGWGGGGGDDGETKAVGYRLSKQQNVRE